MEVNRAGILGRLGKKRERTHGGGLDRKAECVDEERNGVNV